MWRFLKDLRRKVEAKAIDFPGHISAEDYHEVTNFQQFDDRYTAPIHGFESAADYWEKSSCKPVLKDIRVASLLVNAENDPFLPQECFPYQAARDNPNLTLEVPKSGGHVGFIELNRRQGYWMERRVVEFVTQSEKL